MTPSVPLSSHLAAVCRPLLLLLFLLRSLLLSLLLSLLRSLWLWGLVGSIQRPQLAALTLRLVYQPS